MSHGFSSGWWLIRRIVAELAPADERQGALDEPGDEPVLADVGP